jgi:hypothetical protein
MAGQLQNADFKTEAELIALSANKTELLNATKIYSPKTTNVLEDDLRKNNDIATSAPSVGNDSLQGYAVGSRWVDVTNNIAYICVDSTASAAIWFSGSGGGGGAITATSTTIMGTKATSIDGGTFSANTWVIRELNVQKDSTAFCSISGNEITFTLDGNYRAVVIAFANRVDSHKAKLFNVTADADEFPCSPGRSPSNLSAMTPSVGMGDLNISGITVFDVRHMAETARSSDGLGIANDAGADGTIETYVIVSVSKLT